VSRPGLVTFDVYTALVDWEGGLVPALRAACGDAADATSLARQWRAKQLEYAQLSNSLPGGRIAFRVVTRRALDYVLARAAIALDEPALARLEAEWDRLPPWPEAIEVLSELAARGQRLALLSNGDVEMLSALAGAWPVRLEILGSDQAGRYKPHPAMYALPRLVLGVPDSEVLHVAGSANDVLGAKLAGLRCAWSNRAGDRIIDPRVRADLEMRDLRGLL
jgi:2-haloacid dehalogenase